MKSPGWLSVSQAAKWAFLGPYSSLLPWESLTMVIINGEVGRHAEERELRKLEQMACWQFPLRVSQMSNGSNSITGREEPCRTSVIYRTMEVPQSRTCCTSTCSWVTMVTRGVLQEGRSWSTYQLGKGNLKIFEATSKTSGLLLQSVPMMWLWAPCLHHKILYVLKRLIKTKQTKTLNSLEKILLNSVFSMKRLTVLHLSKQ